VAETAPALKLPVSTNRLDRVLLHLQSWPLGGESGSALQQQRLQDVNSCSQLFAGRKCGLSQKMLLQIPL
jgi:hypothetical protein